MVPSPKLVAGAVFGGDYRIVRPLSEGGMGAVYVAEQLSTGKQRALKVMQPSLVTDEKMRRRFVQEARIGGMIDSEHVVDVVGAGIDAPTSMPWLAMELLLGETLAERMKREGPLPVEVVTKIFRELGRALGLAHARGIVHRDLKPENIFLARRSDGDFVLKVLDFGIAKVVAEATTRHTAAMGTVLWMAPEQTDAHRGVDPRADVWALGLIAFHALTAQFYWRSAYGDGASAIAMMREILFDPLVPVRDRARELGVDSRLPPGFEGWFDRCVDRDPDGRFRDGLAAASELATVLAARPPPVAADTPHTLPRPLPLPAVTEPWQAASSPPPRVARRAARASPTLPMESSPPSDELPRLDRKPRSRKRAGIGGIVVVLVVIAAAVAAIAWPLDESSESTPPRPVQSVSS
jgi:eukaryotic-like serine/threonine-protein kinase